MTWHLGSDTFNPGDLVRITVPGGLVVMFIPQDPACGFERYDVSRSHRHILGTITGVLIDYAPAGSPNNPKSFAVIKMLSPEYGVFFASYISMEKAAV